MRFVFIGEYRKGRRGDDDLIHFDYWLNIIKLLSDAAPTLVVMNKEDERVKEIEEQTLKRSFKNILGFYRVSAKKNTNIDTLREQIKKEIAHLPQVGTRLPKAWLDIRSKLEGLKRPYISSEEYMKICEEFGLEVI